MMRTLPILPHLREAVALCPVLKLAAHAGHERPRDLDAAVRAGQEARTADAVKLALVEVVRQGGRDDAGHHEHQPIVGGERLVARVRLGREFWRKRARRCGVHRRIVRERKAKAE